MESSKVGRVIIIKNNLKHMHIKAMRIWRNAAVFVLVIAL